MRKWMQLSILMVSCLMATSFIQQEIQIESFEILQSGIYTAIPKDKIEVESTIEGTWTLIEEVNLVSETDSIPAEIGTHFGFWFVVNGQPKGREITITYVNRLPGLQNPLSNEPLFEEQYDNKVIIGAPSFKGYMFDYAWEAVPGEWIFQVYYNDIKLGEKKFTVY